MINPETGFNPSEEEGRFDEKEQEARREAQRQAVRENAKHILRESGLAEMLHGINRNLLKGRGHFEEYDSIILLRWGTATTKPANTSTRK